MMLTQPTDSTVLRQYAQEIRAQAARLIQQSLDLRTQCFDLCQNLEKNRERLISLQSEARRVRQEKARRREAHSAAGTASRSWAAQGRAGDSGATRSSFSRLERLDNDSLIELCLAGNRAAWDALIRNSENLIRRFARSLCSNHADAADVTAQVFIRLYQSLHTFRRGASYKAWLFRIVRNTYIDLCVRGSDCGHLSLDAPLCENEPSSAREVADPTPTPDRIVLEKETVRRLAYAIYHLPAYQREVLEMYTQGFCYEEIAARTGVSMGTVKSRLNRARHTLHERLGI